MLKKILGFIQERTSGLAILGLLSTSILLLFLIQGTNLPFSEPTIEEFSGGLPVLDTRSSFTPDDAYELFSALGEEGRHAYRLFHIVADTLFPISYSLTFAFISAWFIVRLLPLDHAYHWLSLIPLVSGLTDILENICLVFSSLAYPDRVDWLVQTAFLMNRIKFGLLPIGLLFLIVIVIIWLMRKRPGPLEEKRTR